jgi:ribosomal protein S18 acetylase RimI-like enzyme
LKVQVRKYRNADFAAAAKLAHRMLTDDVKRAEGTLKMACQNKNFTVFVAERDKEVVGLAVLEQRGWNGALGEIWWIVVRWDLIHKSIGKQLLQHVESYAKSHGIKRMHISTTSDNGMAIPFYLKNGYTTEGVLTRHHDGQDVLVFGKDV